MSLNRLIHSIRDLTLSLNPCRGTRHQPEGKSVHSDSLHDRKIVRLLLRNRHLVLPLMILSFVYLLSISEMKIKNRDKFNSPLFTHSIILETKKIKSSLRMILMKKHSPFRPKAVSVMVAAIASSTKMVNHWASWGKRIYNE